VFPHPAAAPNMRASEILSKDEVSLKAAKSGCSATVKNKSTAPARLSFTSRGDVTIGLRGTNHHLDFARGRRDGLFFALDEDLHFDGRVATLQTIRNRQRSFDLTKRSSRE
jgi:hypothetical protein